MDTNGARYTPGQCAQDRARHLPRFIVTPEPPPVHDLLVMSHGPGAQPSDRANHACLNSFASSSWIIADGG
jgi:hypothetical protein